MLEIEYIPLKTPDGATCGHACVRGGYVELTLRRPLPGSALVLTENGSSDAAVGARIPVSAQVSAVALHERGQLRCCGFSRTTALNAADLRRRLHALSPDRADKPQTRAEKRAAFVEEIAAGIPDITPPTPAPEPVAPPAPAPEAPKKEPAPLSREEPDERSRAAVVTRATRVYRRIDTPMSAPAFQPISAPVPAEPAPEPIDTPVPVPPPLSPPAPFLRTPEPAPEAAEPAPEPAEDNPAARWGRDADALLADSPAPVPNPFPHIFPGAEFTRAPGGALAGVWMHGASRAEISAVPGPYSPQPPAHLAGYTRYIRARSGGYWVRVTDG